MDDDFDFEANLALFDKLEVKNLCDSLKLPDRPKKNYRHDEFIIDNPADVYSSAKNSYKYLTGEFEKTSKIFEFIQIFFRNWC